MLNLSEEAKEARRAYNRELYQRTKKQRQEALERYWERKARELRTGGGSDGSGE